MMRLLVDPDRRAPDDLAPAVAWLRQGGIVIYPTDTFYGVAADPGSAAAIDRLFEWKGRRADAALPLIAASAAQVRDWFGDLDEASERLAHAFWPGPLSIVVPAGSRLVPAVSAGAGSLAVRVPEHPVARALADAWGGPLPATSANRSGAPPSITAAVFAAEADAGRVLVIDAGETPGGRPSTIVDARQRPPIAIRVGAVPWDRVLESIER